MTTLLEIDQETSVAELLPLYVRRSLELEDLEFISVRRAILHAGHEILLSGLTESGAFIDYLVPVDLA